MTRGAACWAAPLAVCCTLAEPPKLRRPSGADAGILTVTIIAQGGTWKVSRCTATGS